MKKTKFATTATLNSKEASQQKSKESLPFRLNTKQIQEIPPRLFREMPLDDFQVIAKRGVDKLSTMQLLEVLTYRSWALSQAQVRKIAPKEISLIPPQCFHNITPKTIRMMSPRQFGNITPTQIRALRPMQMCAMTAEHLMTLSEQQVCAFLPSQIAAMTTQQIFTLVTSGKLAMMSGRQFAMLPTEARERIRHLKAQLFPKHKHKVS